jgi:hypothetical protein
MRILRVVTIRKNKVGSRRALRSFLYSKIRRISFVF